MPVNYKNGKIYKLFSYDNDLVYIGSTTQALSKRLGEHKSSGNKACSKILFENSSNVKIELIEQIECDNIEQLRRLEGEHIRRLDCVNKRIPGRTKKEYRENNKAQIKEYQKEYQKEWYENNKEKKKEQIKEYDIKNKEKRKEYQKEYRDKKKKEKLAFADTTLAIPPDETS